MADHILTLTQLQDLFWGVTRDITALAADNIRHAYQGQGQPAWEIGENLVFINITEVDNSYNKNQDITWKNPGVSTVEQETFYTRVIQVDWTLYGPLAFDKADALRHGILTAANRATLAASKVYPLPKITAPQRVPYNFNGQWWERSDLRVLFNLETLRAASTPFLIGASIEIHDESGLQRTIDL